MEKPTSDRPRLTILSLPVGKIKHLWEHSSSGQIEDKRRVAKILAERGIEVRLIEPYDRPWNPFAKSHSIFRSLDPLRALRVIFRERDSDVVISFFESGAVFLLLLRGIFRFKAPIIIRDVGITESWRIRERILDFVIPRADAVLPMGSNQVEYIRKRWKVRGLVEFHPTETDTNFYAPRPEAPSNGTILAVGDDAARDFGTMLEAIKGLDFPVLIKSGKVKEDREVYPNLTVISRHLSFIEYRQLFIDAALVIVPLADAIHASGVTTLLEAMAMGKPVIVSDSEGIRDYIVAGETCLAVPCNDPAALRSAIDRLMAEPETRARLGAGARRFVEKYCSPEAHAGAIEDVIHRLLAARR